MNNITSNQDGASILKLAPTKKNSTSARPLDADASDEGAARSAAPLKKISSTALLNAVREGDPEGVKALLAGGANVNAQDADGWTPLMLATVKGHVEVARVLLGEGADIHTKNSRGWTALRFAVSMDDTEAVRLLLEKGADVNDKDEDGNTALMQAAGEKSIESLILLLVHGADTNIKNHAGETALTIAARHGYPEIVQWLNEAGAGCHELTRHVQADAGELFSEGELEQLIEKIDGLIPHAGSDADAEMQSLADALPAPAAVLDRLAAALDALQAGVQGTSKPVVTITDMAHKLMLSLPEAAALSGLSRRHLRQAMTDGQLKARKIGQGWRVKRADLEAYVEKL